MSSRAAVLFFVFTLLLLTGMVEHILPVQSQLNTGDILVTDWNAGTGTRGALFRVNPSTGARIVLSDFGSGANQAVNPYGVAVESSGNILVTDADAGSSGRGVLFRVDPTTGARTVLSNFGSGANQGVNPVGVAVESSGNILVIDWLAGTDYKGALFRVDPTTGARTVLSDFGSGANQGVEPVGVAVESSGNILVIDWDAGTNERGALFRVDPNTGARTVLSDFGSGDNQGAEPSGVAVESSGNILVTDPNAGTGGFGALFRVNPTTGARTVLSNFGSGANQGVEPVGVAVWRVSSVSVQTATGSGTATFQTNPGYLSLTAVAEESIPAGGKPNLDFPHGFFSFKITELTSGTTVTITITLPQAVPVGTQFWKYGPTPDDPTDHWYQIPIGDDDGDNTITITITDGEVGDDDLTANGEITDQGGPGQPRQEPSPTPTPTPTPAPRPVGGVAKPVNKLQILVPYLALAGTVGAAIVAFTINKRRKD